MLKEQRMIQRDDFPSESKNGESLPIFPMSELHSKLQVITRDTKTYNAPGHSTPGTLMTLKHS